MRFLLSSALVFALAIAIGGAALFAGAGASAQTAVTVDMGPAEGPDGGGDQTGSVTLTAMDDQTEVVVDIDPSPDGATVEQPAHIHAGTCTDIGAVEYALENVVDGQSTTVVDVSLADLQAGTFSINVHKSGDEVGVYTSCGDIPQADGDATDAPTATASPASVPDTGGPPSADTGVGMATYLLIAAAALIVSGGAGFAWAVRRN